MRMVWLSLACVALAAAAPACEDDGGGDTTDATTSDGDVGSSVLTPWSPGTTTKVPMYGNACRLGADTVFESASNGASDDSLTLDASGALEVEVRSASGVVLTASVTLDTARPGKSWRNASGTATWSDAAMTGTVVAGSLCFADELASGADVAMEFSLVMQAGDGSYHSVSGGAMVPGASVDTSNGYAIAATSIDVDLR